MSRSGSRDVIERFLRSTRFSNPDDAIRNAARDAISMFRRELGDPEMPLDLNVLASLLGIGLADELPLHSEDAELLPLGDGRVSIRVNPDRPETRKRFSVAHEISHTFFPGYRQKTWCRTDARHRTRNNPDDLIEMLCDIGASELLLPLPWFQEDASKVATADGLVGLAHTYNASREATVRRFSELHRGRVAAVFFSWRLKPAQATSIGNIDQNDLFEANPEKLVRNAKRLRLEYSIPSATWSDSGFYLPKYKSIDNSGPFYHAACTGEPCHGECDLQLGAAEGKYKVFAIPVWTEADAVGPSGENGVCGIIEPIDVTYRHNKSLPEDRSLF